ncbi:pre-rRNA processing protein Utp22 [Nannizzia gypsea CBS 118893]|uniref:U3 small nucleolar RNA-associated protein 22 n=1 Tax=Arthroderma gypseum (strain ATCC MYA-4604 / CBS 118893) TaxID=535722 RepID=E4UXU4_ARTGP|nr:pre-rRNA processing protein Utp22 [Nannizzia gypsea CBS 118893]EFR02776.1 pre-rRNA processing protein Utp22 [Nannizzia gypsea CBS 118893]
MSGPTLKRRKLGSGEGEDSTSVPKKQKSPAVQRNGRASNSAAEYALARGQYKSSMFKLQIDELLGQLRPDYDKLLSRVEKSLRKLKTVIEEIPNGTPKTLAEAKKEFESSKVAIPFPEPPPAKDIRYTFEYTKPTDINVVGSFAMKTMAKGQGPTHIDLAVTLPATLFHKKDYTSYRYFYKRAYYLARIAAAIEAADDVDYATSYTYQDGSTLRPVLLLQPADGAKDDFSRSNCVIRIITAVEKDTFSFSHTLPSHNSLRLDNETELKSIGTNSTHIYNASLRSEAVVSAYLKLHHSAGVKCAAFKDSCILGRAWLRQRGFGASFASGGFGHFEWATLLALLLEGGGPNGKSVLAPSYSSYQIFKATLQFLSGRDLTKPLLIHAPEGLGTVTDTGFPGLFDGKRGLNILYKMTPWSYKLLQREATLTLKMLNDSTRDHFDSIFITKVSDAFYRFDQVTAITLPGRRPPTIQAAERLQSLHRVLTKSLGDRATTIDLTSGELPSWPVKSISPSKENKKWVITAGLNLDAANQGRSIDHGPSVEDKEESAAFRNFWGDKAELRRFKDGSIKESLVWSDQASSGTPVQQILTYILQHHFKVTPENIVFMAANISQAIPGISNALSMTQTSEPVLEAFQKLERHFQSDESLPIAFSQLLLATPLLRCSPDLPGAPMDAILLFQSSSRWPDDLGSIQMTKVALLLKVEESIRKADGVIQVRVGTENHESNLLNTSFLEVHYSSFIIFRLRIHHEPEQSIIQGQLKSKDLPARKKEELAVALAAYKATFLQAPRHAQALQSLSNRYSLLPIAIRMLKSWTGAHLLAPFIREELLELLTCQIFLTSYPWDAPSNAFTAFLRTLHMMSKWDWQHEPLIVDFGGELESQDFTDIRTRFEAWRKIDPIMKNVALFAASNIDPDGVTWTQHSRPPRIIASRMAMLAKAASKAVREKGVDLDVGELFRSPVDDYDFLLHLSPSFVSDHTKKAAYKNLQDSALTSEYVKHEMVRDLVAELSSIYGEHILFFHGHASEKVIAGLWNPQTTKTQPFGLKIGFSSCPTKTKDGEEVALNKKAILNEIASIAGDIISKVQVLH